MIDDSFTTFIEVGAGKLSGLISKSSGICFNVEDSASLINTVKLLEKHAERKGSANHRRVKGINRAWR